MPKPIKPRKPLKIDPDARSATPEGAGTPATEPSTAHTTNSHASARTASYKTTDSMHATSADTNLQDSMDSNISKIFEALVTGKPEQISDCLSLIYGVQDFTLQNFRDWSGKLLQKEMLLLREGQSIMPAYDWHAAMEKKLNVIQDIELRKKQANSLQLLRLYEVWLNGKYTDCLDNFAKLGLLQIYVAGLLKFIDLLPKELQQNDSVQYLKKLLSNIDAKINNDLTDLAKLPTVLFCAQAFADIILELAVLKPASNNQLAIKNLQDYLTTVLDRAAELSKSKPGDVLAVFLAVLTQQQREQLIKTENLGSIDKKIINIARAQNAYVTENLPRSGESIDSEKYKLFAKDTVLNGELSAERSFEIALHTELRHKHVTAPKAFRS